MKKLISTLCLAAMLGGALTGCGTGTQKPTGSPAVYTNLIDTESQKEASALLSRAGIGDDALDAYWALVDDYNTVMGDQPLFQDGFTPLPEEGINYDTVDHYELWTGERPYSDVSCRVTAFTLLQEGISSSAGLAGDSFLMGDIDALEQYDLSRMSEEELGVYFSLFNPVTVAPTTDAQAVCDALLAEWQARGVSFTERDAKLICVVLHSELDNTAYVGHAGVLVPDGDGWLFVEKLAPTYPNQATRFETREQVSDYLMAQYGEHYTKGEAAPPFLLENDHLF